MQTVCSDLGAVEYTLAHLTSIYHGNSHVSCQVTNEIFVRGQGFVRFYTEYPVSMGASETLHVAAGPYDEMIAPHLKFAVTEAWEKRRSNTDENVIVFTTAYGDEHCPIILEQLIDLCTALIECLLQ